MLLTIVLMVLSAWIAGKMLWLFQSEQDAITTWTPAAPSSTFQKSPLDTSSLLNSQLFGEVKTTAPITQPVVKDAPKTRLNLTLVGAVASSDPQKGLAVIANKGQQSTYGIGELIDGTRVKLKAVLIDRVIIDNSGRDETLMLEGVEYKKVSTNQSSNTASSKGRASDSDLAKTSAGLDRIRAEITDDPQKIFQYVRLSQVKRDDSIVGYRVSPGKQAELFNSVGLKSGDIATQLNGQDLTNPATMGEIFKTISDATELNLTVERDGQQHDIYIEF